MNRDQWAEELVAAMGWAPGVRDGIVAQASAEDSKALNNPLDTELDWPGATNYNAAGVKNYANSDDGIAATKATLENGLYGPMLAAGSAGDAAGYVNACAHSPWGTWSDQAAAQSMLAAVRTSPAYGQVVVAGTGEGPPPVPSPPPEPKGEPVFVAHDASGQYLVFDNGTKAAITDPATGSHLTEAPLSLPYVEMDAGTLANIRNAAT